MPFLNCTWAMSAQKFDIFSFSSFLVSLLTNVRDSWYYIWVFYFCIFWYVLSIVFDKKKLKAPQKNSKFTTTPNDTKISRRKNKRKQKKIKRLCFFCTSTPSSSPLSASPSFCTSTLKRVNEEKRKSVDRK